MKIIQCFLTVVLLFISSQSSALFMPVDFQVDSGVVASSDNGC
jgi:hypothetical protein